MSDPWPSYFLTAPPDHDTTLMTSPIDKPISAPMPPSHPDEAAQNSHPRDPWELVESDRSAGEVHHSPSRPRCGARAPTGQGGG